MTMTRTPSPDQNNNPYWKSDQEMDRLFDEMDQWIIDREAHNAELSDALEALAKSLELKDIGMDTHIAVKDAIYLSELGGVFAKDPAHRVPSENFTVKTLRNAIADGKLAFVKPNKNQFVTRRLITEWLQNCQDHKTLSLSSSSLPVSTTPESLHTKLSGSSDGTVSGSRLGSAKQNLQRLRNI